MYIHVTHTHTHACAHTHTHTHTQVYLNENYAAQDLMCWMEIESFRGIPASDKHVRDLKARQLRRKYFNKKYFFGPNSPANKEAQRQVRNLHMYASCDPHVPPHNASCDPHVPPHNASHDPHLLLSASFMQLWQYLAQHSYTPT